MGFNAAFKGLNKGAQEVSLTQRNYRMQCGIGYGLKENWFFKRLVNPALYVISFDKSVKTRDLRTL
jgi:hypothetical protein